MPASAQRRARSPSRQTRYCSATMAWARALMAASCSAAVSPSGGVSATCPRAAACRPATRTMKNSSRLEATMARNLSRSKSGTVGSRASSSTRSLNSEPGELAVDEQLGVGRIVTTGGLTTACFRERRAMGAITVDRSPRAANLPERPASDRRSPPHAFSGALSSSALRRFGLAPRRQYNDALRWRRPRAQCASVRNPVRRSGP